MNDGLPRYMINKKKMNNGITITKTTNKYTSNIIEY